MLLNKLNDHSFSTREPHSHRFQYEGGNRAETHLLLKVLSGVAFNLQDGPAANKLGNFCPPPAKLGLQNHAGRGAEMLHQLRSCLLQPIHTI